MENHPIVGAYKDGLATLEEAVIVLMLAGYNAAEAKEYLQTIYVPIKHY